MPRVFDHASEREHGALRRGIARHIQRGKSFMNVGDFSGCASVVTREDRLFRMTAENFREGFLNIEHVFPASALNDQKGIDVLLIQQATSDMSRGLLRAVLLNGGPGVDGIAHRRP